MPWNMEGICHVLSAVLPFRHVYHLNSNCVSFDINNFHAAFSFASSSPGV